MRERINERRESAERRREKKQPTFSENAERKREKKQPTFLEKTTHVLYLWEIRTCHSKTMYMTYNAFHLSSNTFDMIVNSFDMAVLYVHLGRLTGAFFCHL